MVEASVFVGVVENDAGSHVYAIMRDKDRVLFSLGLQQGSTNRT
jgi:hypothetical protein